MSRFNQRSLRFLLLFITLTALPLGALGWLGWRFLQQDRELELQRQGDQLQSASELLSRDLQTRLQDIEHSLGAEASGPRITGDVGAFFRIRDGQIIERDGLALPFYPARLASIDPRLPVFSAPERLEFAGRCDLALSAYRESATSSHEIVRAGALVRLARCLRQLGRDNEALAAYEQLAALGNATIAGMPVELIARGERIAMLSTADQTDSLRLERERMRELLTGGRFALDRGTYELFEEKVAGSGPPPPTLSLALAADSWSARWSADGCGRTAGTVAGQAIAALWCRDGSDLRVALVPAANLFNGLRASAESLRVAVGVDDGSGTLVWGVDRRQQTEVNRQLSDLSLPWQLRVSAADPAQAAALMSTRQASVAGGLALMVVIVLAAGVFVFRAVNRELEIARVQADFISAVSHEFRTPLTAMHHMTEMLQESAVPAERVSQYYDALLRETTRLQRVVEGLLDFRRFEAGTAYRMAHVDASETVRHVLESFAAREDSGRLQASLGAAATIRGDREAVEVAVSNLLDNALKYSPRHTPVTIAVELKGAMVGISVQDQGPGIAHADRRRVFRQFERGTAATDGNVKGTGIGLAIVRAVVKAHGGRIDLETVPGQGSRFTLLLPRA